MERELLASIKTWFADYVSRFRSSDPDYQWNIRLKIDHTYRVCREVVELGESQGLALPDLYFAELTALLHDVGRFEQYDRYRTFADYKTEDHAQLGVRVLKEQNVLAGLKPAERELALRVIGGHNQVALPQADERSLFFIKLLRDADKLDIWKVYTEYHCNKEAGIDRRASVELDFPDTPGISPEIYADFMAGQPIFYNRIRSLNDFRLLLIGWIYDVNFPRTYQLIGERNFLGKILRTISGAPEISAVAAKLTAHLKENCGPGFRLPLERVDRP